MKNNKTKKTGTNLNIEDINAKSIIAFALAMIALILAYIAFFK